MSIVPISQLPQSPVLLGTELVAIVTVGTITAITQATFGVVTISNPSSVNPFVVGQTVLFESVGGMTQINGVGSIHATAIGGTSGAWTLTLDISTSGFSAYTSGGQCTATAYALSAQFAIAAGTYNPTFQSGNLQYTGSNGLVAGSNNFIVGLAVPNPSGTPAPCLLIGSGGGSGTPVTACLIQDQAFDNITPGNNLIITSGETQAAGTANGGSYEDFGGASYGGTGGLRSTQGGTSANAGGGQTVSKGGAATGSTGAAIPGDNFVEGGDEGQAGSNVHLIMTLLNGVAGVIRHRVNSTIILDEYHDGSMFFYGVGGGTFGVAGAPIISRGTGQPLGPAIPGTDVVASHVMPTKALTTGGTNGSLTITNGLITAVVDPT